MAIPAKAIALGKAQTIGHVIAHLGYQPCRPLLSGEGKRSLSQLGAQTLPTMMCRDDGGYPELMRRLPWPAHGITESHHRLSARFVHFIECDEPLPDESRGCVALPLLQQLRRWRLRIALGQQSRQRWKIARCIEWTYQHSSHLQQTIRRL